MRSIATLALLLLLSGTAFPQDKPQTPEDDRPFRISTELVQMDVVVVDKKGRVIKGLTKDDFELYESGKRQPVSFFEFVEMGKGKGRIDISGRPVLPRSPQGASGADIGRIFAFVVDDLTARPEDLANISKMLRSFVERQMQATDLVAIVRTVGGKGLLQQFTSDRQLLMRAIDALTVTTHPLNAFSEEKPAVAATKQDEILMAVRSPLARLDVEVDAMLLYKSIPPDRSAIDIHMVIDSKRLQFEPAGDRRHASLDIAGFIYDELGQLRGGFSETVNASLTPQEFDRIGRSGMLYSANTTLPAGVYQVRFAVRDNKSGRIGTMSQYIEVPDLSKGKFFASSLLLGSVPSNDIKPTTPTPVIADRQISRKHDLRYAVVIYNAKQKDGRPQIKTQVMIGQNGKEVFKEPEEVIAARGGASQIIKVGQLGLARVPTGRYTLTLIITDTLADKNSQTLIRSMDFMVIE